MADMTDFTVSLQQDRVPRTMDFSGGLADFAGLPIKYSVDVYECRIKQKEKLLKSIDLGASSKGKKIKFDDN